MSWDSYASNPWAGIATNQREWYVPELYDFFTQRSVFNQFVTTQFPMGGDINTPVMHISSLIPPHPDFTALGARDQWMSARYMDSRERQIRLNHYGGKLALHEWDSLITYWKLNGAQAGLSNIIQRGLGHDMVRQMELLARNSFLSSPFALYGSGTGTKFATVETTDTVSTALLDKIQLGMRYRGVPFANNGVGNIAPYGNVFCMTTSGVIHDLRQEADDASKANQFVNIMAYADPSQLLANGEVGLYRNTRFIENNDCLLWNCGDILAQDPIKAAVSAGDGAPDPATDTVEGVWYTGQADATHYITVADGSKFAIGDEVTVHKTRTSSFGVTNGVDYREGTAQKRVIVDIDSNNLTFDLPILTDFTTDLGGTVYGYVTRARHIHAMVFIGAMDAVVMGVIQPPQIVVPPTVDDLMTQQRIAWKGRFGYNLFEPRGMEVAFVSATNRYNGDSYRD